jgi:uncharacterized protein
VCLGADSTAVAWSKHPDEFSEIQAMIMLQAVSTRPVVEEFVKGIGMAPSGIRQGPSPRSIATP